MDAQGPVARRFRVFFALMPPEPVARQIVDRARALDAGGRAVSRERLHLTLAFMGNVDRAALDALMARADSVRMSCFDLVLDQAGTFRRAGINWLAPSVPPPELLDLSAKLYKNTRADIDNTVFRPHVTISRRSPALKARPISPIQWSVRAFSLVASGDDGAPGAYVQLRQWPLSTPSVGPRGL